VLEALPLQAHELVENVKQQLDTAEFVLIEVEQAKSLLPFLHIALPNLQALVAVACKI
jgi:hypothetical protein